jgi:hypothetical protein
MRIADPPQFFGGLIQLSRPLVSFCFPSLVIEAYIAQQQRLNHLSATALSHGSEAALREPAECGRDSRASNSDAVASRQSHE